MTRATGVLSGLTAGAGLMYLFDPDRGRRRRAVARDRILSEFSQLFDELEKASRDFSHRAQGVAAGLRSLVANKNADGDVLVARVRSRIGRVVSHPHAIKARMENGRVVLEGPVLAHEVDALLSAVSSVPGVKGVENRLEVHRQAGDVSSLQGGSPRRQRSELMQTNWTPALRVLAGAAGGALLVRGARKPGFIRLAGAVAGAALLARAMANKELKRIVGLGGGRRAVDVQKTVNIIAPVEEVFGFWTNYQNFPRFMTHLKEVRDLGGGRSHWIAEGPAGISVTWDAEITEQIPNKLVAWKSTPGSQIENAGLVRFDRNPDGTTRVTIRMSYNPPAGVLGHFVASLFGADPKHEMDDDMVRLKSLIETGKTRAHGLAITREELDTGSPGLSSASGGSAQA